MKRIVKILYIFLSLAFIIYLSLPNPEFPNQLPNSIQSFEPADVETPLRRGYYTNLSREEVMLFYKNQFQKADFLSLTLPTYKLNYPPEEAQILIRDQTRSTYLEEIVHPFRESWFINGFEPKLDKDMIFIDGTNWRQKVIVRYVPSSLLSRTFVGILILAIILIVYTFCSGSIRRFIDVIK